MIRTPPGHFADSDARPLPVSGMAADDSMIMITGPAAGPGRHAGPDSPAGPGGLAASESCAAPARLRFKLPSSS